MNKKQISSFVNFLLVVFFILQILVFWFYEPCVTYAELIEKNAHVFKLDKISWFALVFAGFISSSGTNRGVFRVIFVAVTYSTINEFTGLNNYLYLFEYPVFWTLVISTALYSIAKHK